MAATGVTSVTVMTVKSTKLKAEKDGTVVRIPARDVKLAIALRDKLNLTGVALHEVIRIMLRRAAAAEGIKAA